MYTTTIVFGLFVLLFLWRGYQKGFIHSVTRITSWALAYPAAVVFTKPLADLIFSYSSLDGLMVYFIAGGLVFLVTSFVVAQLITLASKAIPEATLTSRPFRLGGAFIGIMVGGIVGLLVGYAINLIQTPPLVAGNAVPAVTVMADKPVSTQTMPVPDTLVDAGAKKLVSTVAATVIDLSTEDAVATQLSKDIAANPQYTLGHMKQLSTDNTLKSTLADPEVQALLDKGDVGELLDNEEFRQLMENEHLQAVFANTGDDANGKAVEEVAAETLVKAWGRAQSLKHDPRVAAILADKEFQENMKSSNHAAFLMDPGFKQLTEIIVSNDVQHVQHVQPVEVAATEPEYDSLDDNVSTPVQQPEKSDTVIYQWTDEEGKVHFSDKPANE
jgi:uncharacterized membrane protein required for colicin V production